MSFEIVGGWYGPADQFQGVIQPLLDSIPHQPNAVVTPGSYIDSVIALDGSGSLDTSNVAADHDTFVARSLAIPQSAGFPEAAMQAFTAFMGESQDNPTV